VWWGVGRGSGSVFFHSLGNAGACSPTGQKDKRQDAKRRAQNREKQNARPPACAPNPKTQNPKPIKTEKNKTPVPRLAPQTPKPKTDQNTSAPHLQAHVVERELVVRHPPRRVPSQRRRVVRDAAVPHQARPQRGARPLARGFRQLCRHEPQRPGLGVAAQALGADDADQQQPLGGALDLLAGDVLDGAVLQAQAQLALPLSGALLGFLGGGGGWSIGGSRLWW